GMRRRVCRRQGDTGDEAGLKIRVGSAWACRQQGGGPEQGGCQPSWPGRAGVGRAACAAMAKTPEGAKKQSFRQLGTHWWSG
ncbi:hypothetical protein, partial [Xylella fastidiosa]|uniref:hypothetical protein n=1 Tax=Xylella fastidiosa TaxID=2371 RepID=UPI0013967845